MRQQLRPLVSLGWVERGMVGAVGFEPTTSTV